MEEPKWGLQLNPCPNCGSHIVIISDKLYSYNTRLGKAYDRYMQCKSCKKYYKYLGKTAPCFNLKQWHIRYTDKYKNEYVIQKDTFYGKRFILFINLRGCGYWFIHGGAFWLLYSAKKEAERFEMMHDSWLNDDKSLKFLGIPKEIAEGKWIKIDGKWSLSSSVNREPKREL